MVAAVDQGRKPVNKLAHLWSRAYAKAEGWVGVENRQNPEGRHPEYLPGLNVSMSPTRFLSALAKDIGSSALEDCSNSDSSHYNVGWRIDAVSTWLMNLKA